MKIIFENKLTGKELIWDDTDAWCPADELIPNLHKMSDSSLMDEITRLGYIGKMGGVREKELVITTHNAVIKDFKDVCIPRVLRLLPTPCKFYWADELEINNKGMRITSQADLKKCLVDIIKDLVADHYLENEESLKVFKFGDAIQVYAADGLVCELKP